MVKLYTTHCPQCKALEMKLNKAGIEYEWNDDMVLMNKLGFKAAPVLEVDGEYLNFTQAIKWVNEQ